MHADNAPLLRRYDPAFYDEGERGEPERVQRERHAMFAARKRAKLSREELARRVGCSPVAVQKIEQGRSKNPGLWITSRIAAVLGVEMWEIFADLMPARS